MEKGKGFVMMMAWCKEELQKTREGTSLAIRPPISKSTGPSHTVNAALRIGPEPEPSLTPLPSPAPKIYPRKGGGKRTSSWEKSSSSHKTSKRKVLKGPLITGLLDLNVRITECLQYNLTLEEKKPFKGMTSLRLGTWRTNWTSGPIFAWLTLLAPPSL